ncbi:MAG: pilus assembly protein N-terminal domain-containing protein, partial [Candidatus Omnitrophota bacterium]|nr:pilus assembly protein N-terminal domain-containing protein [Candidatus Omnitrophota bacterium]
METKRAFKTLALLKTSVVMGAFFLLGLSAPAQARVDATTNEVNLLIGELETIDVKSLTRLSITDPKVVDIVEAKESEILIIAKAIGQSALFVWDENGKRTVLVNVAAQNLGLISQRLEKLFSSVHIDNVTVEVNGKEGKVVLTGQIFEDKKDQFDQVIAPFNRDIINLVKVEKSEDLIEVDIQITELTTTLTKAIGIDWASSSTGPSITGLGAGGLLAPTFTENVPSVDGSVEDLFKIGNFQRTYQLIAMINALLEEGKARILSKPKLVVVSGEEASFNVGGEIPIRTTTTSQGSTQENVTFKKFGIGMTITPTIKKGKIDLLMEVEVSDIDSANKVGENVAFTTRNAQTRLYLDNGQPIVIAGLIKKRESELVKKVPFLGSIPIIGILFRSKSTPSANEDQELVISLTPLILNSEYNSAMISKITPPLEVADEPQKE